MTASIRDVAKRAGVTHGTVSKVFGGNPKYAIPQATRERILTAADELGYRPHYLAKSLKRGRTDIYGFYSGSRQLQFPNMFIAHVVDGLRAGCNDCQKDLLLVGTFRGTDPGTVYDSLADGKIDGLVLFAFDDDPLCELLQSSPLPVVAIVDPIDNIPTVTIDEEMGGRLIASYLAAQGHRRVCYCYCYGPMKSAVDRRAAFLREARKLGMTVFEFGDPSWDEEACLLFDQMVSRPRDARPTAVVCWHDGTAYELMDRCAMLGLSVPEDLAIIGFDGLGLAPGLTRQLSSVAAPWNEVARQAVHLLDRRIAGEQIPSITRLPVELAPGVTS